MKKNEGKIFLPFNLVQVQECEIIIFYCTVSYLHKNLYDYIFYTQNSEKNCHIGALEKKLNEV